MKYLPYNLYKLRLWLYKSNFEDNIVDLKLVD